MKTVMLDYASKQFSVTEEGYARIRALITQYQLCDRCRQPIDQSDHLLVGRNLCLSCLLQRQPQLTFLGPLTTDDDGDILYSYVDPDGIVSTSRSNSSTEAKQDVFFSLQRAGFTIPERYVPFKGEKDNPLRLGHYNWTIYGKLHSSVLVLEYKDTYPAIHAVFLSYKGGQVVELHKRSLAFKQLFERAKQIVEATKKHGVYHINGYEQPRYSDETLYPIIAQLEAAVWDVQRQFLPAQTLEASEQQSAEAEDDTHTDAPAPVAEQPKRGRRPRLSLVSTTTDGDNDAQEAVPEPVQPE